MGDRMDMMSARFFSSSWWSRDGQSGTPQATTPYAQIRSSKRDRNVTHHCFCVSPSMLSFHTVHLPSAAAMETPLNDVFLDATAGMHSHVRMGLAGFFPCSACCSSTARPNPCTALHNGRCLRLNALQFCRRSKIHCQFVQTCANVC